MAFYNGDYETDLGLIFRGITLASRWVAGDGVETFPDEAGLLPASFRAAVGDGPGPCSLGKIVPRRARLSLSGILRIEIPLPFQGGSTSYLQFLSELRQIPDVRAFDLLPEKIPPYFVNIALR